MNVREQEMNRSPEDRPGADGKRLTRRPSRTTRWLRRFLWLLVVLFLLWQGAGFMVAYDYLSRDHHQQSPLETPADRNLPSISLTIPVAGLEDASDGEPTGRQARSGPATGGEAPLQLAAWLLPADPQGAQYQGGATIVMLHGFGSSRARVWLDPAIGYRGSMFDQGAESLWQAGFHVLMLDFRNHGDSGDRGMVTLGYHEREDVAAVLRYLRSAKLPAGVTVDPERIGLRGGSMGGVTALLAAADADAGVVGAIWVDSAFAEADAAVGDFLSYFDVPAVLMPPVKFWLQQLSGIRLAEVRPVALLDQINCPVMIAHSRDDTMIRVNHFQQYKAVADKMSNVETWLVAGVQHHRLIRIPGYIERQREFFLQHLGSK